MSWSEVGNWIKGNAGTGAALVGSLLTGNVPGAVAAGVSLVASATGTDNPADALQILQADPQSLVRLKELYYENESDVRRHLETMTRLTLEDQQSAHQITQATIQGGDKVLDKAIRMVRPGMAKQSWWATIAYCLSCTVFDAFANNGTIFDFDVAVIIASPAWAYMGLRQLGKITDSITTKKSTS